MFGCSISLLCAFFSSSTFSSSSFPALGCQSIFQSREHLDLRSQCHCFNFFVQTFETTSVLALFPITPILQTLPALGPRPPEISTKWFFMAWPHTAMKSIPSGTLIVFTVGNLWESKIKKKAKDKSQRPGFWIWDKHLKTKISKTSLECVGGKPVSPPAVLEPLLGNHGEALAQPVHGVHRPCVVVDPPLALPAVPVLAQPVEVQVE